MTVAGNIAFLFGGASSAITEEDPPIYLNDFYMITVSPNRVTWELMPQKGSSHPEAKECLPGVYCFDIVTLTWEKLLTGGVCLRTLRHGAAALGENIYAYGGILNGVPTDDLMMFNTVSLNWMPIKTTGALPSTRYDHSLAVVGEQIFLFGGCSEDGTQIKDLYALNTETLVWEVCKDIYLFGGTITNADGVLSSTSEIHKLSIGKNEEQDFNDLKIMKLINPSERQPVMKEILSEFGLQGVSNSFAPTKIPNVKYELSQSPVTVKSYRTMHMIHKAFAMLDEEFQKLDREKEALARDSEALRNERDAQNQHLLRQKQELQDMLERHRLQNEAWLRARADENDRERKELCKLREEVLQEQERLKEEQCNIQKRSEQLLSIMQQFKGM
ncbi:hypothetical protein H4Q32_025929 [Labeo rohita]|uniref:Uncharacterized protein n=1 Tax=Labeo rohita TaxID=84645 RepID=A0ABQ8MEC7_LABRO|nr:hypothetical protein H4Q32_025929 [Labeo rohita]